MKDLVAQPIKFKHRERSWLVKIGADPDAKQFLLTINGRAYEDLEEWDDKGITKSSMENNWKGNVKKTEYVVMDNDQEVSILVKHDEKNSLTKI